MKLTSLFAGILFSATSLLGGSVVAGDIEMRSESAQEYLKEEGYGQLNPVTTAIFTDTYSSMCLYYLTIEQDKEHLYAQAEKTAKQERQNVAPELRDKLVNIFTLMAEDVHNDPECNPNL